jgi:hypothetical protein
MPGFVVDSGATVLCAHGGQAMPITPNQRVLVSGQAAATTATAYAIAGCPSGPPNPGPCVSAQWLAGVTRVLAGGIPVVTQESPSVCEPTGTPLNVVATQVRVSAT